MTPATGDYSKASENVITNYHILIDYNIIHTASRKVAVINNNTGCLGLVRYETPAKSSNSEW